MTIFFTIYDYKSLILIMHNIKMIHDFKFLFSFFLQSMKLVLWSYRCLMRIGGIHLFLVLIHDQKHEQKLILIQLKVLIIHFIQNLIHKQ